MAPGKFWSLVGQSISRNKRHFLFSAVGIVVGVSMFTFFVALGEGIRDGVLNRIYPINQVEIEPRAVNVLGVKESLHDVPLTVDRVKLFADLAGVAGAYPKQRSRFQARLWGGKGLFERDVHTEAFFDGIDPSLLLTELQASELGPTGAAGEAGPRKKRQLACLGDDECGPGQQCQGKVCTDIQYFEWFRDWGEISPCTTDAECAPGARCLAGRCREVPCEGRGASDACGCKPGESCGDRLVCAAVLCEAEADCGGAACVNGRCESGACAARCEPGSGAVPARATCGPHEWCVAAHCVSNDDCGEGQCVHGRCASVGICEAIPCALDGPNDQLSSRPSVYRGRVVGVCGDGSAPDPDGRCEVVLRCPDRTYCAPESATAAVGQCERPVPVLLSPFLIEVFNSAAATALGLRRVSETHALLGVQFRIQYGDSFFSRDEEKSKQVIKRAQVVGFSNKALELGVTMPLRYVERANARFRGRVAAAQYDSVILEAERNEAVPAVTRAVEQMGFELSSKSRDAKKAGNMLYILTVVFALISWIIMSIAAINISHTFLMVISERKKELGVLRAIGATRGDIRRLVLGEAALVGLVGGLVGNAIAFGAAAALDAAGKAWLSDVPFLPQNFFVFELWAVGASLALALLFCVFGAFFPANRAARLDPAVVLTQP